MDSSGNNRYELLFMDDEGAAPAPAELAGKKKETSSPAAAAPKKAQSVAKKSASAPAEKENKANNINKNDAAAGKKQGPGAVQSAKSFKQGAGGAPSGNKVRVENGEARNRRNAREGAGAFGNTSGGGEFGGNEAPRQVKEREYRGPPRHRFGENNFRGGKREFDRQSGSDKTGVKAIDKRDGAGAHNWGSVKEEIDDINKSNPNHDAVVADKDESTNEQIAVDQSAVPEEEETKEMTLDEWKATRGERAKPQYNLRKAGEGEDTSQWKKMIVLNKKKKPDAEEEEEEELEYDPSLYPQRVGRLQRIVDIQFNFNDGRRGGGGGFGRGRGRGMRPGGDNRGAFEGRGGTDGENRGRFEGRGGTDGENRGRFERRSGADGENRGRFEGRGGGAAGGENRGRFEGRGGGSGNFADGSRGSGAPRARNFGDRQRGGGGANALRVDDESQFPTLS